ncbi:MAG: hypothetical protein Ta2G_19630 [Termitinemataceae bacterium]|nr:MAG: hypothetical protein Ta2G_19630 [Termitinemataceae bacterium]
MLDNIIIVLSHPKESGNVGAVCRVMKNCGLFRLRIAGGVGGHKSPLNEKLIRDISVHAFDVWENSQKFDTLQEAVADCRIVIGTSRRRGEKRKKISLTPGQLAQYIAEIPSLKQSENGEKAKPIALVFGNERSGLDGEEMDLCNIASHIPSSKEFCSFNLSHAVGIYCYALFLAASSCEGKQSCTWQPLCVDDVKKLSSEICDSLQSIGFYKIAGRCGQEHFFTDIFARAGITKSEGKMMKEIFNKVAGMCSVIIASLFFAGCSSFGKPISEVEMFPTKPKIWESASSASEDYNEDEEQSILKDEAQNKNTNERNTDPRVIEIKDLVQTGTYNSLRLAVDTVNKYSIGNTEFGRLMQGIAVTILRKVYFDIDSSLPVIDLPAVNTYSKNFAFLRKR